VALPPRPRRRTTHRAPKAITQLRITADCTLRFPATVWFRLPFKPLLEIALSRRQLLHSVPTCEHTLTSSDESSATHQTESSDTRRHTRLAPTVTARTARPRRKRLRASVDSYGLGPKRYRALSIFVCYANIGLKKAPRLSRTPGTRVADSCVDRSEKTLYTRASRDCLRPPFREERRPTYNQGAFHRRKTSERRDIN
jgi:hypothetical protein